MQCFVPVCSNTLRTQSDSPGITFHRFPTTPRVRTAWLQALNKQGSRVPRGAVVCSQHFLTDDFCETRSGLKKIRPGAIPFVLNDIQSSDESQKPTGEHKQAGTDIVYEALDTIKIKNEQSQEAVFAMVSETLFKQEPLDQEVTELNFDNFYDANFDVFKNEIYENSIEIKNSNRKDTLSITNSSPRTEIEMLELQKSDEEGKSLETHSSPHSDKEELNNVTASKGCNQNKNLSSQFISRNSKRNRLICDICHRTSKDKTSLVHHIMRAHTGEKPYSCAHCQYKCVNKGYLRSHMKTHTGEKSFTCDICKKKFANKTALIIHMRTHTGEKPYACELCHYKTGSSSGIIHHMRSHLVEKRYHCNV
ncbi:zinc finger protein 271-like isoform X2 [Maniola jurtina]|nr:zinc finger protein 271-like isoform X2 [Maniola jurtina]